MFVVPQLGHRSRGGSMFRIIMFMSGSVIGSVPKSEEPHQCRLNPSKGVVVANCSAEPSVPHGFFPFVVFVFRQNGIPPGQPVSNLVQVFSHLLASLQMI